MYVLIVAVHVIACVLLIAVILLQAGRGGGLSEAFGGSSTQTILGTRAPQFLTRATAVCAILFLITSIVLGIMTSRRGRSLIDLRQGQSAIPVTPIPTEGAEEAKEKELDTEEVPVFPKTEPETK